MRLNELAAMVLGALGFFISLFNLIYVITKNKRHIEMGISEYKLASFFQNQKLARIWIEIENKSRLPISITRITLLAGKHRINVYNRPHKVFEITTRKGSQVTSSNVSYSVQLPIVISPLGAFSGDICFVLTGDTLQEDETNLTLEIGTTRGSPVQMKFSLDGDRQVL